MSSPFQQKFSKKNPVKTFTLKQLERQAKKDDKEMYKNSALLPQINQGDYDYESEDEQEFPGDDRFTYEKKTQASNGSVAKMASPLNAYVSTAGHFQRMQDNIAAAFTPKKKNKDEKSVFKEFESKSDSLNKKPEVNLKGYDPSADYSGTFEDSKRNLFNIGQGADKSKNHFNRFGQ
jgi:hypothetical protein